MSEYIEIHPTHPQPRTIELIVDSLRAGAVIAYPTDSGYALGCCIGMRKPMERITAIRRLDEQHHFTLICRNLSEIARYAQVDNATHRLLRRYTPGGYTFILKATHEVPKLILAAHRKTIGVRIPDHQTALAIAEGLQQPLLSTSLILPDEVNPLIYPEDISDKISNLVDLIIDAGYCGFEPTTIVDCTTSPFEIIRTGSGDPNIVA